MGSGQLLISGSGVRNPDGTPGQSVFRQLYCSQNFSQRRQNRTSTARFARRAELKLNSVVETYSRFAAAQKACLTVLR
jgi:hypothetical protein